MHEAQKKPIHEDTKKMQRTKKLVGEKNWKMEKASRGHDLVRRLDRQGEVLIWCRKCSGCARQRMGPKSTNCCTPEKVSTEEHGKMLKRIQSKEESY